MNPAMRVLRHIALLATACVLHGAAAQVVPEFNMMDTTVTDCKGILYDSEVGPGGTYGTNEDFVFTIDAGSTITMTFVPPFCLEQGFDFLTFHDGPSINSPQIGPAYSGVIPPPPIVATSGLLTIHFVSDHSVTYCGWEAHWTAEVDPPVPPVMTIPQPPVCGSNTIGIQFSFPVPCDSLNAAAFQLTGNGGQTVTGAMATGCSGGETSTAQVIVDPPFDRNCPYDLSFTLGIADRCDSVWFFTLESSTQLTTCPLGVLVEASQDTICAGQCVQLLADVQGCMTYTYAWNNGVAASDGPHTVCPTQTTTYTVQVTEQGTGQTATGSVTVVVIDPQVETFPDAICQSADPFDLVATPPGGWFTGAGILDSLAGHFHPDTAGPGFHTITYQLAFGCTFSFTLVVDSMDAGLPEAACPGTEPFLLDTYSPQGGTWSGPFIQPNGLFDPSTEGSYEVTYTAGNCTDTRTINVADLVGPPSPLDTVCQSEWPFIIPITPFGGRWSGPGIVDTLYGVFDPHEAAGGTHTLTYTMYGCSAQFQIHVKPADIGSNRSVCPSQGAHALTPAAIPPGGTWQGAGITDPVAGVYDPQQVFNGSPFWDVVTYHAPNGCVDTIRILTTWTSVQDDTLFFCEGAGRYRLNEHTTGRTPWDGIWSGPGIVQDEDEEWFFHPTVAGVGLHVLPFVANGCSDTLIAVVHPSPIVTGPIVVCGQEEAFVPVSVPPGGTFSGPGIIHAGTGLFDPATAGPGLHTIQFSGRAGCTSSFTVEVLPYVAAHITGVGNTYCGNDMLVEVGFAPLGGVFTGLPTPQFNPAQLAPGSYTLTYTIGTGACASTDTVVFVNHPPLTATLNATLTTLCGGGSSQLTLEVNGGQPGMPYFIQWDNGLFPSETQTVSPTEETTYTAMITDACSDPIILSVTIDVYPEFTPEFTFSEIQCHGDDGWVQGSVPQDGNYSFLWNSTPPQTGSMAEASAGSSFVVTVTNTESGCTEEQLVQIPAWPAVTALFSANPSLECIPFDRSAVTFIDLSNNAVGGTWTINGDSIPYVPGEYPQYDHGMAGHYEVTLDVYNEGGCISSHSAMICILASSRVFVPDAFSPNDDGRNDVLFVRAPGIETLRFEVYDRWGGRVFATTDTALGWDGTTARGKAPSGVYVYMLDAVMRDGEIVQMTGDVTLVR